MLKFFALPALTLLTAGALALSATASAFAGAKCPGGPRGFSQRTLYDGAKASSSSRTSQSQAQQAQANKNK